MVADWPGYNEALIMSGEILLDLGLLQSWGEELEVMNRDREGGRYRYPHTPIRLQGFIRACFLIPYRQLEGFTLALSQWEPRLRPLDYSTTCRRVNRLEPMLEPHLDPERSVTLAVDASGIKVADRGGWIRRWWKRRRGLPQDPHRRRHQNQADRRHGGHRRGNRRRQDAEAPRGVGPAALQGREGSRRRSLRLQGELRVPGGEGHRSRHQGSEELIQMRQGLPSPETGRLRVPE